MHTHTDEFVLIPTSYYIAQRRAGIGVATYIALGHVTPSTFNNLALSANLPTGLYNVTFRNFFLFLTADKLSQDPLDRFSRCLHQMIRMCFNMTDLDLFFDFSRDVAMATS